MVRRLLIAAVVLWSFPALAAQKFLVSTYSNHNGCAIPPATPCEVELTDLAITDVISAPSDATRFVLFNLNLNNTVNSNPTQAQPLQIQLRVLVDGTDSHPLVVNPGPGIVTVQLPFTLTGMSIGSHTYQFLVTQNTSGPINYTTATYGAVLSQASANAAPTATPLVFGTPGVIPIFASTPGTQLGHYAGATCPTPGFATGLSAAGALLCATPVPVPTATPQPTATVGPTATPQPTATPGGGGGGGSPGYVLMACAPAAGPASFCPGGGSSEGADQSPIPITAGVTLKNLYCHGAPSPGGSDSVVFIVRMNATNTALTCTISGGGETCNDTTHTAALAVGDLLSIEADGSATNLMTHANCSFTY